jgi:cytochrome c oxidase subunit II
LNDLSAGASAVADLLRKNHDPNLRVFVIWEPVLATDWGRPGRSITANVADPRATHYWDPQHRLSSLYGGRGNVTNLASKTEIAFKMGAVIWDAALVYPPRPSMGCTRTSARRAGVPLRRFARHDLRNGLSRNCDSTTASHHQPSPPMLRSLHPASPEAGEILALWNTAMWICGFIMAIVTAALVYMLVRYRQRDDSEPPQHTGNKKLEIAWTVVPILLVALLFGLSARTTGAIFNRGERPPDIVVTGHQWWWEVYYPHAKAYTANEIHIPTGRDILVGVESADVAHDFWVPELGPKTDAIPRRRNLTWIRADDSGEFRGFCAEFCGNQHAWMLFRVVAQQPADYDAWLAHQAQPAARPTGGDAAAGSVRFRQLTCANCHNITGTNEQQQYAPDLTHMGSRQALAGERITNTPEKLRDWLHEPNIVKRAV